MQQCLLDQILSYVKKSVLRWRCHECAARKAYWSKRCTAL